MNFLCIEFVNSSWYIYHKHFSDPLRDKSWLILLADKWNIGQLPAPSDLEMECLIEMRSRFSQIFKKVVQGNILAQEDVQVINSYLNKTSFYREFQLEDGSYTLSDIPKCINWDWFMAEIAASFARLYSSETKSYLKECLNPECGWFFVDESKSKTRKWCDDTCATLMKVRRFRQKQKEKEK